MWFMENKCQKNLSTHWDYYGMSNLALDFNTRF